MWFARIIVLYEHFIENLFQKNKVQKITSAHLVLFTTKHYKATFIQKKQLIRLNTSVFRY